jgi:nucleotide-binding universal stress UspA family protein
MSKHQVVVAYDFSKHADVALQRAVELAVRDPDNVLHFVTVLDASQDPERLLRPGMSVTPTVYTR